MKQIQGQIICGQQRYQPETDRPQKTRQILLFFSACNLSAFIRHYLKEMKLADIQTPLVFFIVGQLPLSLSMHNITEFGILKDSFLCRQHFSMQF